MIGLKNELEQDPNDFFLLIIVLYGVNNLVFALSYIYEHDVHEL